MQSLTLPKFPRICATSILAATLSLCASARAQTTYYWDSNDSTSGFGTAVGTWAAPTTNNSTQGWSTSATGVNALSGTTNTTTADALNFGTGTASYGLGGGTITVSGTVNANSLTFGSQSGAIILSGGTISLGGTTPTVTVNNAVDTISSAITGSAGLTKNGTGILTLSGNSTYSGNTTINAGTLKAGSTTGLSSGSAVSVAAGATLDLGGFNNTISSLSTATGTITNSGGTANLTITTVGSGAAQLFTGNLGVVLNTTTAFSNANNTYSGGTFLTNGRILWSGNIGVGTPGALTNGIYGTGAFTIGNSTVSTAQLYFQGQTFNNAIVVNSAQGTGPSELGAFRIANGGTIAGAINANLADATFNSVNAGQSASVTGAISGNSGVVIMTQSAGVLNITLNATSGANTYAGNTTISTANATLTLGKSDQISNGAGKGNLIINSGKFNMGGFSETINGLIGNGTVDGVTGTPTLTVGDNNATSTFSGVIKNTAGTLALTKNGTGTLTLSGANTYNGTTTVNAGTLTLSNALALQNSAIDTSGAGVITLSSVTTPTFGGLKGSGNLASVITTGFSSVTDITLNPGSGVSNTYSGVLSNGAAGMTLTKNGSGTQVLSGANTYTGATTINAGTLTLSGGSAIIDTGAVSVASGAVLNLGASETIGSIAGAGNVTLGSFTLTAGGDNSSTTASGIISGTGNLTKTGTGTLTLSGANAYTGTTTVSAGTLKAGSTTGFSNNSAVSVAAGATMDLSGYNNTIKSLSTATGTITNSGASANLTITTVGSGAAQLFTGNMALVLNTSDVLTNTNSTYSGGTYLNSGRPILGSYAIGAGTPGALTNGLYGTGAITIGNSTSSLAQLYLAGNTSGIINNAIVVNSALGNNANELGAFRVAGSNPSIAGAINANLADVTFNSLNTGQLLSVTGAISGNSGVVVMTQSAGVLNVTLNATSGANTYAGNTTISTANATLTLGKSDQIADGAGKGNLIINSGTFKMGGFSETINGLTGNGTVDGVSGTPTLTVGNNNATSTFSGVIKNTAGTLALTKTGTGTLTLSGANTYAGATTISAGTLSVSGGSAIADTGVVSVSSGAVLNLGASETVGSIAGAGNIALGSNTLTAGGANSNTTVSGVISGTGALTKTGTGALTLSGENTYSGATTVSGGTLAVGGNLSSSALTINTGAVISAGTAAAAAKFNTSSLTINGGAGYNFTIGNVNASVAGVDYDQIASSGALTLNNTAASPFTIYLNGTPAGWSNGGSYSWDIISAASQTGFTSGNFSLNFNNFGIASGDRTGLWAFTNPSGGTITLSYTASNQSTWSGTTGNWSSGFSPALVTDVSTAYTGAGGTATNDIASGTLSSIAGITFDAAAGAYTLAANAGSAGASGGTALIVKGDISNNSANAQTINMAVAFGSSSTGVINANSGNITISGAISGTGSLSKAGNSTLTLSGANTYAGATTINAGTLTLNGGSAIPDTGAVTVSSGGVLNLGASETVGSIAGAGNIALGSYTLTSGGANSSTTLSGIISGTGGMTKNGTGTLTLSGANTYTGSTTINAGTLALGSNQNLGTISGAGNISLGSYTLTTNATSNTTLSGAISGTGVLTKNGTGTLTLAGSNTYSGVTTVSAGTLKAGSTTALNSASAVTVGTGATLDLGGFSNTIKGFSSTSSNGTITNSGSAAQLTISSAFGTNSTASSSAQLFTGSMGLQLFGGSTTDSILTNTANTYSGGTVFGNGSGATATRLLVASSIGAGSPGAVTSGIYGTGTITMGAAVTDLVQFYFNGAVTINNAIIVNSAAGQGGVDIGAFRSESTGVVLAGSLNANLADAVFSAANTAGRTISVTGAISGNSGLTVTSSGSASITLTLNNAGTANSYAGNTTISTANATLALGRADQIANGAGKGNLIIHSGTLKMAGFSETINGLSGNGTVDGMSGTPTLTIGDNDATSTFSGVIKNTAGTLALTKIGNGTLSLAGANTFSGSTAISAGNLSISSVSSLGSTSGINLSNATALIYTGGAAALDRSINITTGTGTIRNSGSGLLTLSGGLTKNGTTLTLAGGSSGITVSGVISGSSANSDLTVDGGTVNLTNTNTYNGPTTIINSGTLNANAAGALPTSTLSAVTINGSSTLALGASQSVASLSGTAGSSVTLGSNTLTINGSSTTTYSGAISGTGNLVKNGSGTQTLAGATTYTGATTVNSGTLTAAAANALGNSTVINVDGGSFLVTAANAVNDNAAVNLGGGRMAVSGNFDETVGLLTLSANSTIDFSGFAGTLRFGGIGSWASGATLAIWNWSGTTQYGTQINNYATPSNIVFTDNSNLNSNLSFISFYSDSGSSFVGNGFEQGFSPGGGTEIIAVPEPEAFFYAAALLAGIVVQFVRRRAKQKSLELCPQT